MVPGGARPDGNQVSDLDAPKEGGGNPASPSADLNMEGGGDQ